ncbi:predicted protein [Nematostella vectensis]|uniref:Uncharacterized protein n=1 Tax=Nematostella vectensis TaxID=45351 RepID=A7T8N5_NEMVE|nr:predicted protein [Nematostella vectensis]|eukprot:XP_001619750.1 hypothetical protein NEMVEDRAFT_v1g223861 [Nematostella vectensis]
MQWSLVWSDAWLETISRFGGLTDDKLKKLAQAGQNAVKTSRRDLPYVLSKGLMGGTTVSGTMIAAHKAGIPVFVTGGIGGVHRGAQELAHVTHCAQVINLMVIKGQWQSFINGRSMP